MITRDDRSQGVLDTCTGGIVVDIQTAGQLEIQDTVYFGAGQRMELSRDPREIGEVFARYLGRSRASEWPMVVESFQSTLGLTYATMAFRVSSGRSMRAMLPLARPLPLRSITELDLEESCISCRAYLMKSSALSEGQSSEHSTSSGRRDGQD